uniref:Uncharacterized protein n=1 Tax=Acartia pacifica TaxID=335913 RepID=A0A0U2V8G9_ACAPC|nr:hypothetical protein [Acartia pacifica]
MEKDARFYQGALALSVTFILGFTCGYQFKTWRLEYLKSKRERLAAKLQATQREIDMMKSI